MEPVYPKQLDVPLLISGDWSDQVSTTLNDLSLTFRIIEGAVGRASSIKMVRSIMVKGLEALTAECALAAYAADVVDEVFPSLRDGHPKIDVEQRATYNFERSMTHGVRRAAEMDEVAKMVDDLGLPNDLAQGSANWQRIIADNTVDRTASKQGRDLQSLVDELLPVFASINLPNLWIDHVIGDPWRMRRPDQRYLQIAVQIHLRHEPNMGRANHIWMIGNWVIVPRDGFALKHIKCGHAR